MTDHIPGPTRRVFLKLAAAAALIANLPVRAWAFFIDSLPTRTVERTEFDFDPSTGRLDPADDESRPYVLTVEGLVDTPLELDYAALRALPQTTQTSDFHCVEGWSVAGIRWTGVRFSRIAALAGPGPEAVWVVFHALGRTPGSVAGLDHYRECLPLVDLLDPRLEYLLALDKDGAPLSKDRGAPLRLVTPFDLAYKSIKFVERVEFTARPHKGWWTLANSRYPLFAPVPRKRLRGKAPARTKYPD